MHVSHAGCVRLDRTAFCCGVYVASDLCIANLLFIPL